MNIEKLIKQEEVSDQNLHYFFELFDWHAMYVTYLNYFLNHFLVESQWSRCHDKSVNDLENNISHAWELESLDSHFHCILDTHSYWKFIDIIVLNSNH